MSAKRIPMTNVHKDDLRAFVAEGFAALGLTEEDAGIFADALVFSELRFHPGQGQGVMRLRRYQERIGKGEVDPRAGWSVVKEGPALALVDAHNGIGTVAAAKYAAAQTREGVLVSVAGGGDTVAALHHAGVADDFTYVSTAGGAFLEWMEGKPLPGVEVLKS